MVVTMSKNSVTLPEPACRLGYSSRQVNELLSSYGLKGSAFSEFMRGQTMALCDGTLYNHDTQEYEPSCGEAHGVVVYPRDLSYFLQWGARKR